MATRVWDAFLTAADKASLKERPHQVWGYGERPALVLIDSTAGCSVTVNSRS
jgi:hypothetical protein